MLINVVEVVLLMIHIPDCVFQNKVKNVNVKVFHLMSGFLETRSLLQQV